MWVGKKHEPDEQAGFYDNTRREPKMSTTMPLRRKLAGASPKDQEDLEKKKGTIKTGEATMVAP